ncbi:MAG: hypothetical protein K0S07_85 [Chlamydiales bacterium]|jgi:hypothetical protein|nr:hypothetical protein [Chlamydiales bacterium]
MSVEKSKAADPNDYVGLEKTEKPFSKVTFVPGSKKKFQDLFDKKKNAGKSGGEGEDEFANLVENGTFASLHPEEALMTNGGEKEASIFALSAKPPKKEKEEGVSIFKMASLKEEEPTSPGKNALGKLSANAPFAETAEEEYALSPKLPLEREAGAPHLGTKEEESEFFCAAEEALSEARSLSAEKSALKPKQQPKQALPLMNQNLDETQQAPPLQEKELSLFSASNPTLEQPDARHAALPSPAKLKKQKKSTSTASKKDPSLAEAKEMSLKADSMAASLNRSLSLPPSPFFSNAIAAAEPAPASHQDMQAVIEQISSALLKLTMSDREDTTFTIAHPPLFAGSTVTLSEYHWANKEYNISFCNLSMEAKALIDRALHQESLKMALQAKGLFVQNIISSLDPYPYLPDLELDTSGKTKDEPNKETSHGQQQGHFR